MSLPVILAIDGDADALRMIDDTLCDRYGRDYRVECTAAPDEARSLLERLVAEQADVALVLASQWLDGTTGTEILDLVRRLHPHARRGLLIAWGDWGVPATGDAIYEAISHARIDHFVVRPTLPPDELFHHTVSGWLLEWADAQRVSPRTVNIIGESWSGRAYELRELLEGCALPHTFSLADSDGGRDLVAEAGVGVGGLPLVIFPNGAVLRDPTNVEIVEAAGSRVEPPSSDTDLLIIGAGPAGLSAA